MPQCSVYVLCVCVCEYDCTLTRLANLPSLSSCSLSIFSARTVQGCKKLCVSVCVCACVLVGVGAWLHLPPAFLSINLTFTPYPGEAKWGWPAINVTISHLWCALLVGHPQYFFTGSYHMEIPFCNGYIKIHKVVISLSATLNLDVNWTEYILNSVVELKGQFTQK